MASIKQIEANRRNALRSTGPRTAAGKAAVRFNALKAGIDAASVLIPGEESERFQAFAAEFAESCAPADPRERELVDQMIEAAWRLRRLRKAETQVWTRIMHKIAAAENYNEAEAVGDAMVCRQEILLRTQRLITSVSRSYHQAAAALDRLQTARRRFAEEVPDEPNFTECETNPISQPALSPSAPSAPTAVLPPVPELPISDFYS